MAKCSTQRPKTTLLLVEKNWRSMLWPLATFDSMVFWRSSLTQMSLDAGHRNGVPVYEHSFSTGQTVLLTKRNLPLPETDADGRLPYRIKLEPILLYYGFDGYFINQENNGEQYSWWKCQFMLYTKEYGSQSQPPDQVCLVRCRPTIRSLKMV